MKSALSIGNFDGLHLGHQKLVDQLVTLSRQRGLRSVVITYGNHPAEILNPHALPLILMPAEQKRQALLASGLEQVELLRFDRQLANQSAEEFLHDYLIPAFDPGLIVVGYDSHFGKQRRGNFNFLQEHQNRYSYDLVYVEPYLYDGRVVSSSLIREMLILGDLDQANQLLGRHYTLYGKVVSGLGCGAALGFPTANLQLADPRQLVPRSGLYLSRAVLYQGSFFGLTNIGCSPTVKSSGRIEIETHILDFDDDIYDSDLQVELLRYLREEKLFESKEALMHAMTEDLAFAQRLIAGGLR